MNKQELEYQELRNRLSQASRSTLMAHTYTNGGIFIIDHRLSPDNYFNVCKRDADAITTSTSIDMELYITLTGFGMSVKAALMASLLYE